MNNSFDVTVRFEGCMVYEVEAETEKEAKEKAVEMFGNESDAVITSEICECEVSECVERSYNEVTEFCPHCDTEVTMYWDIKANGYKAFCPHCGGILMLCSECYDDNAKCDWSDESECCFRTKE